MESQSGMIKNSQKKIKQVLDKWQEGDYCIVNSSVKYREQDMTYSYHRLQKAAGCARQQQGVRKPSPASRFGEDRNFAREQHPVV